MTRPSTVDPKRSGTPDEPSRPAASPGSIDAAAARRRPKWTTIAGVVLAAGILAASAWGSDFSPGALIDGVPHILDFVSRMFPPDLTEVGQAALLMVETLAIAITGTFVGIVFAIPIGLLAAQTVYPERWVHYPVRTAVNVVRAIPELMWALLFVSAVGLGPLAGSLAIAIGSAAGMGRLFGDIFESGDFRAWQAASATGASRPQRISWVLLPESTPILSSYALLVLDSNVRAASLLGLVGAGGIGMELNQKLRLFEYGKVMTIVLVVLVVVVALDRMSAHLRRRLA